MTVETVTYITDFNTTYPDGGDAKSEGDNHIRNIKTGIGGTFPNFTGIAMTATEAELNTLDGITATTAELNILDGVTSTAAELNILDGVTATAAELNTLDESAKAATGFTYGNRTYIDTDGVNTTTLTVSTLLGAAWESIGPTGSGATNIWTAMDNIPSDATWVECYIVGAITSSASGGNVIYYAQKNGTGGAAGLGNEAGRARASVSGTTVDISTTFKVPLDSSQRFEMYEAATNAGGTVVIVLKAFGA